MALLKLILSHHQKSNGNRAIRLRITKGKRFGFLSTQDEINEKDWDKKLGCAKKTFPSLNVKLNRLKSEISEKIYEMERKNPQISIPQIMDSLNDKTSPDMIQRLAQYVEAFKKDKIITYESFLSRMHNIQRFTKNRPVMFEEVTTQWLDKLQAFMKEEEYAQKTIASHLSMIRTIVISAVNDGVIRHEQNPFTKYKIIAGRSAKKEPLNEAEVQKIRATILSENVDWWLYHAKWAWLFSATTIGYRVRDLLTLKWGNIHDYKQISIWAHKTGKFIKITLPAEPREILKIYSGRNVSEDTYVFPFLDFAMHTFPDRSFERLIKDCTKWMNQALERLARYAKIEKKISNHSARNTFINRAIENGVQGYDLMMLTQHSDLRTLELYINDGFQNSRIDEVMKKAHKE